MGFAGFLLRKQKKSLTFIREKLIYRKFINVFQNVTSVTGRQWGREEGGDVDFYQIKERAAKNSVIELFPDFKVCRSKDLMVRGRSFYAIWDEDRGMWSTDEYDVQRLVDGKLVVHQKELTAKSDNRINVKLMSDFSSNSWAEFRNYIGHISDNAQQLDTQLTFANTTVNKKDYVSKRLNYPLEKGKIDSYDKIIGTLYDPEEREKLEWAIGAIVSGDSKDIQKFIVLYGEMGSGKSTILNIIQKLFMGYYVTFEAKALTASGNTFSTEAFKSNPLVAIQHDGDLSKIEDNTKLNSIVSHEEMSVRELYKPSYTTRFNAFLFMGTNKPVKITDAKSGVIRRLIDVKPSGNKIPPKEYQILMSQIDFELGAIAKHCLDVYRDLGKNYYSSYRPIDMMMQTDIFYNFVECNYDIFKEQDGVSLAQAYAMYKTYCDEALIEYKAPRHKFREELRSYFKTFSEVMRVAGLQVRSYYSGFLGDKLKIVPPVKEEPPNSLLIDCTESIFDTMCAKCPAQYANDQGTPIAKWSEVRTKLNKLDTHQVHYVKVPDNHIVIDFDLKDETGTKSLSKNIDTASKWPATYTELSKSGNGLHLHYIYDGDVTKLSRIYSDDVEVKVFTGNSSLRRKLSTCNNIPVATINSGLPLKEEVMINFDAVKSEKGLRALIKRNLKKEIHPSTKPSLDFIQKILEDAYSSGLAYDVTDMRPSVLAFANNSSNQSDYCVKLVSKIKFKSEEASIPSSDYISDGLVFFDVEVFPNLFVVVWKAVGRDPVRMINPTPADIESILNFKLVGFNCRRYDNHMLYAAYIGYDNAQLYTLSQRIISGSANCMFSEAYGISYTDVYDFASAQNKMSLKKWEIKLGIHHHELGLPWDKPVDPSLWIKVADYCINDVMATETTFNHLSGDWAARQILAELSGLTVNDTTNTHTTKIVFGTNGKPQNELVYTDLSVMFPGYKFENGKSTYRGIEVGEGGFVHGEPGMYANVPVIDVGAMHPSTIEALNYLGPYTKKYSELKQARIAIKHKDLETLKTLLDGRIIPFIKDSQSDNPKFTLKDVSNGLKTALNAAYGLTFARFDNPFKDPRNIDNIIAKRGALFMVDLMFAVQERGFQAAHIKTDSIKIPEATPEIIEFVMQFGKKYGYDFEHENTYEKLCLVNNAVYVAKYSQDEKINGRDAGTWTTTGAQFSQPYVFKTLFSREPIEFEDTCETKSVTTALYLDMNENLPEDEHNYHFVGKVGSFCPIQIGHGGGILLREKDGKYNAASGTKGYRWLESEVVKVLGKQDAVSHSYYMGLVNAAVTDISKFGDYEWFISDDTSRYAVLPCGSTKFTSCLNCPDFDGANLGTCQLGYENLPI